MSKRLIAVFIPLVFATLLAGCANSPPVQEMSDARQAIAAAREAGAAELAAAQFSQAESLLGSAENHLQAGNSAAFWQAKKAALSAKEMAFEALLTSRNAKETPR